MIIALCVIAYILCGLVTARIVWFHFGPHSPHPTVEPDGEDMAVLTAITIMWPLMFAVGVVLLLARGIKAVVTYDIATNLAKRKTQRIERELDHD